MPDDRIRHNPAYHRLDRRVDQLIANGNPGDGDDDLLDTPTVACWLGMSEVWLRIGRAKDYGPRFVVLGPQRIRYRRCDVLAWLQSRTFNRTDQYDRRLVGGVKTNLERAAARAAGTAPVKRHWGFRRGTP
jgi:predicted DNA-binding transcriptional regulator AlpA